MLRTPDWLCALALLAEPVAAPAPRSRWSSSSRALAPHAGRNAVMDDAWAAFGPVARPLGVLAAAAGRRDEAVAHFERAAALAAGWGAPAWALAALADWLRVAPDAGRPLSATAGWRSRARSSCPASRRRSAPFG